MNACANKILRNAVRIFVEAKSILDFRCYVKFDTEDGFREADTRRRALRKFDSDPNRRLIRSTDF